MSSALEVSHHGPSRATLTMKLRCLPVIFPLASKGGCQLTMTARGFPSRVMTVRSLGAEVGAAGGTETRPCHRMWEKTDIYGTSNHDVDTQHLSCSISCWFYHLQFLSSIWIKEANKHKYWNQCVFFSSMKFNDFQRRRELVWLWRKEYDVFSSECCTENVRSIREQTNVHTFLRLTATCLQGTEFRHDCRIYNGNKRHLILYFPRSPFSRKEYI